MPRFTETGFPVELGDDRLLLRIRTDLVEFGVVDAGVPGCEAGRVVVELPSVDRIRQAIAGGLEHGRLQGCEVTLPRLFLGRIADGAPGRPLRNGNRERDPGAPLGRLLGLLHHGLPGVKGGRQRVVGNGRDQEVGTGGEKGLQGVGQIEPGIRNRHAARAARVERDGAVDHVRMSLGHGEGHEAAARAAILDRVLGLSELLLDHLDHGHLRVQLGQRIVTRRALRMTSRSRVGVAWFSR